MRHLIHTEPKAPFRLCHITHIHHSQIISSITYGQISASLLLTLRYLPIYCSKFIQYATPQILFWKTQEIIIEHHHDLSWYRPPYLKLRIKSRVYSQFRRWTWRLIQLMVFLIQFYDWWNTNGENSSLTSALFSTGFRKVKPPKVFSWCHSHRLQLSSTLLEHEFRRSYDYNSRTVSDLWRTEKGACRNCVNWVRLVLLMFFYICFVLIN